MNFEKEEEEFESVDSIEEEEGNENYGSSQEGEEEVSEFEEEEKEEGKEEEDEENYSVSIIDPKIFRKMNDSGEVMPLLSVQEAPFLELSNFCLKEELKASLQLSVECMREFEWITLAKSGPECDVNMRTISRVNMTVRMGRSGEGFHSYALCWRSKRGPKTRKMLKPAISLLASGGEDVRMRAANGMMEFQVKVWRADSLPSEVSLRSRQVDLRVVAPQPRPPRTAGRNAGQDLCQVLCIICIILILCVLIGLMAYFGSRLGGQLVLGGTTQTFFFLAILALFVLCGFLTVKLCLGGEDIPRATSSM